MRAVLTAALVSSLVFIPAAHAAAPPNDNRADAQPLAAFPAQIHSTLVEATVERLDPQVSDCGTIASTVWYRIDTAPDGTIGISVKGGPGVAPVVRVYSRGSSLREVTCKAADSGGAASVSFDATRGANYFVLVGRKPASADGDFDLSATLRLPPEPPANDKIAAATRLKALPATTHGTTVGARSDDNDPSGCDLAGATVWYRLRPPHDGLVILKLHANGKLDAVVGVVAQARSRMQPGSCRQTDGHGNATVAFRGSRTSTYFVIVGQQEGSKAGTFALTALAAAPAERAPGRALPGHAVRATLNGLTNVNDIWHTDLVAGTTYRIAFSSSGCVHAVLRHAKSSETLVSFECSGYRTFTPGPDGGGRYVVEALAAPNDRSQPYRLEFAAAGPDDVGVGLPLLNQTTRRGSLAPRGVDIVDIYHFDVVRRSDVKLSLTMPGGAEYRLVLVTVDGSRLGGGTDAIRRTLEPGRYVVAVQAPPATQGGGYRLSLLVRDITSTTLALGAKEVPLHGAVSLQPLVAPAATGVVEIQIDRFDPLGGWQFSRLIRVAAGSGATWSPPSEGTWRVRATYLGSQSASPSRSEYAYVAVR